MIINIRCKYVRFVFENRERYLRGININFVNDGS